MLFPVKSLATTDFYNNTYFLHTMRRNRVITEQTPCWFITTTMVDWLPLLLDDSYYAVLSDSINFYCKKYMADICGYVWMPNHIHCIVFFNNSRLLPSFMRDFKKYTAGQIRRKLQTDRGDLVQEKLEYEIRTQQYKIWMDRYDAVPLWKREHILTKLEYIHNNPVKRNLVVEADEYKYSSAWYYSGKQNIDSVQLCNIADIW